MISVIMPTHNKSEYLNLTLNITYLYQTKGNAAKARNVGLAHAKGDMIVFADDDRSIFEQLKGEINESNCCK